MRKIDLYIFRQLAGVTLFATLVLAGLVTVARSLSLLDLVVNRGLPVSVLLELTLLLLPTFVAIVLPIATFVAVLWVYGSLGHDSELVILGAAGVSPLGLGRAAVILAGVVMAVAYFLYAVLSPLGYGRFKDRSILYRNAFGSVLLQEGRFNAPVEGLAVYVRQRGRDGALNGIFVHDSRDPDDPVTLMAERGFLVRNDSGVRIVLVNGNRQEIDKESGRLLLLYFEKNAIDLAVFSNNRPDRWREMEERRIGELFNPGDSPDAVANAPALRAEGHRRLAMPLTTMSFALLALASVLSGPFSRRGQYPRIVIAVALAVTLQILVVLAGTGGAKLPALLVLLYALPLAAIAGALLRLGLLPRPAPPRAALPRPAGPLP